MSLIQCQVLRNKLQKVGMLTHFALGSISFCHFWRQIGKKNSTLAVN